MADGQHRRSGDRFHWGCDRRFCDAGLEVGTGFVTGFGVAFTTLTSGLTMRRPVGTMSR